MVVMGEIHIQLFYGTFLGISWTSKGLYRERRKELSWIGSFSIHRIISMKYQEDQEDFEGMPYTIILWDFSWYFMDFEGIV
jgi:hypothetical protein